MDFSMDSAMDSLGILAWIFVFLHKIHDSAMDSSMDSDMDSPWILACMFAFAHQMSDSAMDYSMDSAMDPGMDCSMDVCVFIPSVRFCHGF